MKYSLLWIFIAWMLVSCNDFLEESSQDEVRPTTVEDLMQVMIGEAYPMGNEIQSFFGIILRMIWNVTEFPGKRPWKLGWKMHVPLFLGARICLRKWQVLMVLMRGVLIMRK